MINSLSYHPPVVRCPKNAWQFIHYIAFVFLVLSSNATHKYVTNYLLLWQLLRTTRPRTCAVFLKASSDLVHLRGPAPKKGPMISGSKIESADFYLPSRGYRILFKNEFLLFQFPFKPKISSRKLFPSDSSKIRPKISPRKNRFRNHYCNAK